MSVPMGETNTNPVGRKVDRFQVIGEEFDGERRRVGADMLLDVKPIGRFFLRIATKEHYVNDMLETKLSNEDLEKLLTDNQSLGEERLPYVLNDQEITNEILQRKFQDRIVEEDLAATLWYQGPTS